LYSSIAVVGVVPGAAVSTAAVPATPGEAVEDADDAGGLSLDGEPGMRFATDVHPPTAAAVSVKASKVAADPPRIKLLPGIAQDSPYPALTANYSKNHGQLRAVAAQSRIK
jgi:hypothetical protein